MKKITTLGVVSVLTLSLVSISYASIDKNLKYGQRDKEVTELQEFLIDGGFLKGAPTTFFGLLTLKAVKAYQNEVGVSPTGYVGVLTRQKINDRLVQDLASSTQAEIQETGTTTQINSNDRSSTNPTTTTVVSVDFCKNIEGPQIKVPDGMFMNSDGICFTPTTSQPTIIQPTNNQPQYINQNNTPRQPSVSAPVTPKPTCTLTMNKIVREDGLTVARTVITSVNATKRILVQTMPYGVSTSTNENNDNVNYTTNDFNTPMQIKAIFSGGGGEVTCTASVE